MIVKTRRKRRENEYSKFIIESDEKRRALRDRERRKGNHESCKRKEHGKISNGKGGGLERPLCWGTALIVFSSMGKIRNAFAKKRVSFSRLSYDTLSRSKGNKASKKDRAMHIGQAM